MSDNYNNVLGGPNFDAVLSSEDHKVYRDLIEKAILSRFLLSLGAPPNTTPKFGIADLQDPSIISSLDTTRPLAVSVSTQNPLQVSVNSGYAVTQSAAVVSCPDVVFSKDLARTQPNDVNLVFLENELVSAGKQALNDYMDNLHSLELQSTDMLRVDLISNYMNPSLYPESRKKNIVALAVATVLEAADGSLELSIDQTRNTYSFLRPWLSVMDVEHRSSVGTGIETPGNPHRTSYNDISTTGNVNLFQGLVDTGMIVSRDMKLPKLQGAKVCYETLPLSRIKTDTTGLVTEGSVYGRVGAKYCELLSYPTTIGSCYEVSAKSNGISVDNVKGTNILVFGPNEVLDKDMILEYTEVSALLPPVNVSTNLLSFSQPNENELIVVGGKTLPSIPDPLVNFEGSGPFPRTYKTYLLPNRSLVSYPQTIFPATRLDVVGTTLVTVNTALQFPSRLRVAMTRLDAVATMSVRMVIYGTDTDDNNITEYITISSAKGYVDESLPSMNYDAPLQGAYTNNVFKTVNTIQVLDQIDNGPLGVFQIWGEIEQSTAEGLNDALVVSEVYWNGQGVDKVKDLRLVSKGFYKPTAYDVKHASQVLLDGVRVNSLLASTSNINKVSKKLFSEDFENMKYFDTIRGKGDSSKATGYIVINNNAAISSGDTIQLVPGKILTAVVGTAVAGSGQFSLGATVEDTKTNIVAAINHPSFASGCDAYSDNGSQVRVVLNTVVGSAANAIAMGVNVTTPNSISVAGFSEAYDGYNECYFDRNVVGLSSDKVPLDTETLPVEYHYRKKYRSRAVAIPVGLQANKNFLISCLGLDVNKKRSVRIKASYVDTPKVWTEWIVLQEAANGDSGLYMHEFAEAVHKIQIEVYGTAHGVAVYAIEKSV